jgi:hypothetical protein
MTHGFGRREPRRTAAATLLHSDRVAGTRAVTSWLGPEKQEPSRHPQTDRRCRGSTGSLDRDEF